MKRDFILNRIIKVMLLVLSLTLGQNAWAESTWTVENDKGKSNTFTIKRSEKGFTQTVHFRTISLSAYAGQHFTAVDMDYTFLDNEDEKTVTVTEMTPTTNAYKYQTGTSRKYGFEVIDRAGFRLAYAERSKNWGTSVTSSGVFDTKDVTIQTSEYTADDRGYDKNGYKSVGASSYCTSGTQAYLGFLGAQLRMTLSFDAKENDDAYEYLQILFGNTSTCDSRSGAGNGNPGTPSLSRYMAGFEMNTGAKDDTYRSYTFPVTSVGDDASATNPWGHGTNHPLINQKFKSGYRATDGRLIVPVDFSSIVLRLNASGGSGSDEWAAKNVIAHIQAVDGTAPTKSAVSVNPGRHAKGNTVYVSVAFNEIVTVTGTPTLTTTSDNHWGSLSYVTGSGTNVLTFSTTIPQDATGDLNITGLSGTVKDLAGNSLTGSGVTASGLCTLNGDLAYTLNDFQQDGGNYLITCHDDLIGLAGYVNGGGDTENKTFLQVADIAFPHTTDWDNANSTENNYNAIGYFNNYSDNTSFQGTFNGQGYTISGIRIYKDGEGSPIYSYQGIFGYIIRGTIRGIHLTDTRITAHDDVGGIVGNCYNSNVTVEDCIVDANVCIHAVKNSSCDHGGIIGDNRGLVHRCISHATLSVKDGLTDCKIYGGIVGHNYNNNITDCIADGVVIPDVNARGAIVGYKDEFYGSTLTRNYYHDCKVASNSVTPSGVGMGTTSSKTTSDVDGAQPLWAITLPNHASVVRTGTTLPVTGYAIYDNGADIAGVPYSYEGATVALGYSGEVGTGYHVEYSATAGTISGSTLTMPAEAVTVSSTFPANNYTVRFNKNNDVATGTMDDQAFTYDVAQNLTANAFTAATGYVFNGWNTQADGNGASYTNQQEVSNLTTTQNGVFELYAQWTDVWGMAGEADGTEQHPYTITTTAGLDLLANDVNNGINYSGKYFVLGDDITYPHTTDWDDATSEENNYTAIGKENQYFCGYFNGDGHTISGIRIYKLNTDYQGLFGKISSGALVKKVTLTDARITARRRVGGIAGNTDDVSTKIDNCLVLNAAITAKTESAPYGGVLVGFKNYGTYSHNFYRNCIVKVGSNTYTTNIGLGAPRNDFAGEVSSVHTLALPDGVTASGESVVIDDVTYYANKNTITLSFTPAVGYVLTNLTVSGTDATNNGDGTWSFTMPAADATVTPTWTDAWGMAGGADGTEQHPYTIKTTAGLDLLATNVNNGNSYSGMHFVLGDDITYPHTTDWDDATSEENNYTAIGTGDNHFDGIFDGLYHTISGIRIYKPDTNFQGLFGITSGGTIKNIVLSDARITGYRNVGGIAGYLTVNGTLQNCLVLDTEITATYYGGVIAGDHNISTLTANYYRNCSLTTGSTTKTTDIGVLNADCDGARSVHTLTLPDGVSVSAASSVTYNNVTYYASTSTVTVNSTVLGYVLSNVTVNGTAATDNGDGTWGFQMPAADALVIADHIMTWASLKNAMKNGGSFTLPYDITATATDTYLHVPESKTVTLDLNGHTINRNLTEAVANGFVIKVEGTLTINDSSDLNAGSITGGYSSSHGGGVYMYGFSNRTSTFTMNGGNITGNTTSKKGGGVYVYHGSFTMNGGTISNNTSTINNASGGGVYVDGLNGVFNMTGGTICGNTGNEGAGVFVGSSGENLGSFTLSGGTICDNRGDEGGGVYSHGNFTMSGGNISNNIVSYSTGGGVYIKNGSFNISGSPVITGNIKSSPSSANNVYLKSGKIITVIDALTNTASIGVTMQDKTGAFTTGLDSNGTAANFTSDASAYLVYLNDSGEAALDVAYSVNIDDGITNGTVTTNQVTTVAGTIVTLIVTPSIGYSINTVSYNDGTDHEITAVNDVYSFTMPAGNVTVTATFSDVWGMAGGADGTVQHPYTITTTAGLDQLATLVNSGNSFSNRYFRLGGDITYSHKADNEEGADTENNYTAIGGCIQRSTNNMRYFCGTFDGQGHTVSGIRIYKGDATIYHDYQGLFGLTSRATIKNVILADARITGRQGVGGIAGYLSGTVENCRVGSDVTIHAAANAASTHGGVVGNCSSGTIRGCVSTATLTVADGLTDIFVYGGIVGYLDGNMSDCLAIGASVPAVSNRGAIVGDVYSGSTRTNNYYHACTVGASTHQSDAYTVSAGTDVTASPAGDADATYDYNGIKRYGDALYYGGVLYAPEEASVSLTLCYNGSVPTDLSVGYAPSTGSLSISSNPYTLTMPDGDVTINAFFGVEVPYIDEKGVEHIATAIPLDNTMMTLAAGTYVVNSDVTYTSTVTTTGDVTLILADGCTMSYGTENDYLDNTFINCPGNLTIYGQVQGTGLLKAYGYDYGISVSKDYTQHSGNVFIRSMNGCCITTGKDFTLLGGTLDLLGGHFCDGDIEAFRFMNIQGGKLWARYKGLYSGVGTNLDYTKPSDLIYAKKYNSIPSIADDKTFVNERGKAISRTLYLDLVDVTNKTLRPVMGVTLTKDGNNISATFSGTSLETVNIPAPGVTVKEVTYNRTFSADKASTVMLPFDYTCNGNEGGTFYRFVGVEKENNIWVATMQLTSNALTANTPYLFLPTGTGITFTIPNEGVTLCTEGGGGGQTADSGSHWTFKGTNSYIKWTTNTNDPDYSAERAAEIGKVYGFAGVDKNEIKAGDFVKVASGAKIRPMSAYLIWSNTANLAPARGGMNAASASADELPKSITVRLINANGTVTNVGEIDMETGEVSFNGWYTLQGVKLEAEPTEPGIYINNGKKVSIK